MLKDQFLIGDIHDGDLDEMIVLGSSVLSNEINHARSIPMNERVLIRKESSVMELQEEELDSSNCERGSVNNNASVSFNDYHWVSEWLYKQF